MRAGKIRFFLSVCFLVSLHFLASISLVQGSATSVETILQQLERNAEDLRQHFTKGQERQADAEALEQEIRDVVKRYREDYDDVNIQKNQYEKHHENMDRLLKKFSEISDFVDASLSGVQKERELQTEAVEKGGGFSSVQEDLKQSYESLLRLLSADQKMRQAIEMKIASKSYDQVSEIRSIMEKVVKFFKKKKGDEAEHPEGKKNDADTRPYGDDTILEASLNKSLGDLSALARTSEQRNSERLRELSQVAEESGKQLVQTLDGLLLEVQAKTDSTRRDPGVTAQSDDAIGSQKKILLQRVRSSLEGEKQQSDNSSVLDSLLQQTQDMMMKMKNEIDHTNRNTSEILKSISPSEGNEMEMSQHDDTDYKTRIIVLGVFVGLTILLIVGMFLLIIKSIFFYHRKIASLRQPEQRGVEHVE